MAGKYKRIYLSAASTLLGMFLIMTMIGVQITSDGDKTCDGTLEDPCISYLKVYNPTAKSIYIYIQIMNFYPFLCADKIISG